ncbi:MAG: hypothetical protein ABGY29_04030 [bacterium]
MPLGAALAAALGQGRPLGKDPRRTAQDNATRWSGIHDLFASLVQLRVYITQYMGLDANATAKKLAFTDAEWAAASQLCAVFEGFQKATAQLQFQSQGTAPIAYPIMKSLRARLAMDAYKYKVVGLKGEVTEMKKSDFDALVVKYMDNALRELDTRLFDATDSDEKSNYPPMSEVVAQILHPYLKGRYLEKDRYDEGLETIRDFLANHYKQFGAAATANVSGQVGAARVPGSHDFAHALAWVRGCSSVCAHVCVCALPERGRWGHVCVCCVVCV